MKLNCLFFGHDFYEMLGNGKLKCVNCGKKVWKSTKVTEV